MRIPNRDAIVFEYQKDILRISQLRPLYLCSKRRSQISRHIFRRILPTKRLRERPRRQLGQQRGITFTSPSNELLSHGAIVTTDCMDRRLIFAHLNHADAFRVADGLEAGVDVEFCEDVFDVIVYGG
jgi:hypothetical protein